jgi:hypothetical protein
MKANNPVYDLCLVYKTVYERTRKRDYTIGGRDMREAKTLLELNSDVEPDKVESYALEYFKGKNDFWKAKEFPAYGLFMQFNEYAPKKVVSGKPRSVVIECSTCNSTHEADEKCKTETAET